MNKPKPQPQPEPEVLRPPFKRSAEAERLENYLGDLPVGEIVSYERIMELIGEDPQRGSGYAICLAVRSRLVRDGQVWFAIPAVGLKRANESETMEIVHGGFTSIKRKNHKNQRYLTAVDYGNLSNDEKREFNWLASVAGALKLFFNRAPQKRLQEKVAISESEIDPKSTLKLFSGEK